MRPISVQCVFSRLISTVIAKRQSTREWILQHAPAFSHGGIPGRGPATALLPLEQAFAKGGILVALDLSKAFDRVQPLIAFNRLSRHGMHPQWIQQLEWVWTKQIRWLHLGQHVRPRPYTVSTSIPQGCACSPLALNFLLFEPAADIQRRGGQGWCKASTSMTERLWPRAPTKRSKQ